MRQAPRFTALFACAVSLVVARPLLAGEPARADLERPPDQEPTAAPAPEGGLAVEGYTGAAFGSMGDMTGVHLIAAVPHDRTTGPARIGVALAYEQQTSAVSGPFVVQLARVGAAVAIGAPWDDSIFGFEMEVGVAAGVVQSASATPPPEGWLATPYAQWSLLAQVPLPLPVRPFGGVGSELFLREMGATGVAFLLSAGIAWNAW